MLSLRLLAFLALCVSCEWQACDGAEEMAHFFTHIASQSHKHMGYSIDVDRGDGDTAVCGGAGIAWVGKGASRIGSLTNDASSFAIDLSKSPHFGTDLLQGHTNGKYSLFGGKRTVMVLRFDEGSQNKPFVIDQLGVWNWNRALMHSYALGEKTIAATGTLSTTSNIHFVAFHVRAEKGWKQAFAYQTNSNQDVVSISPDDRFAVVTEPVLNGLTIVKGYPQWNQIVYEATQSLNTRPRVVRVGAEIVHGGKRGHLVAMSNPRAASEADGLGSISIYFVNSEEIEKQLKDVQRKQAFSHVCTYYFPLSSSDPGHHSMFGDGLYLSDSTVFIAASGTGDLFVLEVKGNGGCSAPKKVFQGVPPASTISPGNFLGFSKRARTIYFGAANVTNGGQAGPGRVYYYTHCSDHQFLVSNTKKHEYECKECPDGEVNYDNDGECDPAPSTTSAGTTSVGTTSAAPVETTTEASTTTAPTTSSAGTTSAGTTSAAAAETTTEAWTTTAPSTSAGTTSAATTAAPVETTTKASPTTAEGITTAAATTIAGSTTSSSESTTIASTTVSPTTSVGTTSAAPVETTTEASTTTAPTTSSAGTTSAGTTSAAAAETTTEAWTTTAPSTSAATTAAPVETTTKASPTTAEGITTAAATTIAGSTTSSSESTTSAGTSSAGTTSAGTTSTATTSAAPVETTTEGTTSAGTTSAGTTSAAAAETTTEASTTTAPTTFIDTTSAATAPAAPVETTTKASTTTAEGISTAATTTMAGSTASSSPSSTTSGPNGYYKRNNITVVVTQYIIVFGLSETQATGHKGDFVVAFASAINVSPSTIRILSISQGRRRRYRHRRRLEPPKLTIRYEVGADGTVKAEQLQRIMEANDFTLVFKSHLANHSGLDLRNASISAQLPTIEMLDKHLETIMTTTAPPETIYRTSTAIESTSTTSSNDYTSGLIPLGDFSGDASGEDDPNDFVPVWNVPIEYFNTSETMNEFDVIDVDVSTGNPGEEERRYTIGSESTAEKPTDILLTIFGIVLLIGVLTSVFYGRAKQRCLRKYGDFQALGEIERSVEMIQVQEKVVDVPSSSHEELEVTLEDTRTETLSDISDDESGNSSNNSSIEMGEEETTNQDGSVDEDVEGADSTEVCIDDLLGLSLGLPNDGIGPAPPEMGTTEPSQTPEELGSTTPSIDDDDIPAPPPGTQSNIEVDATEPLPSDEFAGWDSKVDVKEFKKVV